MFVRVCMHESSVDMVATVWWTDLFSCVSASICYCVIMCVIVCYCVGSTLGCYGIVEILYASMRATLSVQSGEFVVYGCEHVKYLGAARWFQWRGWWSRVRWSRRVRCACFFGFLRASHGDESIVVFIDVGFKEIQVSISSLRSRRKEQEFKQKGWKIEKFVLSCLAAGCHVGSCPVSRWLQS